MFPKELYKDDIYRVVHSTEENDACTADGWKSEKAAGVTYKPLSAIGGGSGYLPALPKETKADKKATAVEEPAKSDKKDK